MLHRSSIWAVAQAVVLLTTIGSALAADESRYPNLKGQWNRFVVKGVRGQPSYDQTKSWGPEQDPPLTPEYERVFQASLADLAAGGVGNNINRVRCNPAGRKGPGWGSTSCAPSSSRGEDASGLTANPARGVCSASIFPSWSKALLLGLPRSLVRRRSANWLRYWNWR